MSQLRRQHLIAAFDNLDLDGLLVSSETNVGYLTGFTGDSSTLIVARSQSQILSDGRFTTQLSQECPGLDAIIRPIGQPMSDAIAGVARSLGIKRLGFESHVLTVAEFESLSSAASDLTLVATQGIVETLRMIKDADEIAQIREAVQIAETSFAQLRAWLKPGVTEKAAADFLEAAMRENGATGASFPPIVAFGPNAALPHARPDPRSVLGVDDLVLVDWGATGRPYKSDLTRVLATGKVASKFESVYRAVLEAQLRAIDAIHPGVRAQVVDLAARNVITHAGYGPNFNHSVGHGIGRDVHEAPVLRSVTETELRPGMVVTVEPGIYLPGWGGVRIEDDVLVTETGCEVLSRVPKTIESTQI